MDCHFFLTEFGKVWPDPAPMYYESYTHGVAKGSGDIVIDNAASGYSWIFFS